jgi:hypothetical protein
VGPKTGLVDVENTKFLTLPGLELQALGRPARSQSLYRLRYHGCRCREDDYEVACERKKCDNMNVAQARFFMHTEMNFRIS